MGIKKTIAMAMATTALGATLIASGTVSISLDKPDGTKYFNITNMAPGDKNGDYNAAGTTAAQKFGTLQKVTVRNGGSLDLRYLITETLIGALAGPDTTAAATPGLSVTIYDSSGAVVTPITPTTKINRVLAAGKSEDLYVRYELPRDAGDFYQDKSAILGLKVDAVQTKNNLALPLGETEIVAPNQY
jgi:hypothetical protein